MTTSFRPSPVVCCLALIAAAAILAPPARSQQAPPKSTDPAPAAAPADSAAANSAREDSDGAPASTDSATALQDGSKSAAPAPAAPLPSGKTYDLRYRFEAGDVLRYSVEHRASIRSTIDDTTQAAQTKTDSVKLWKVTDVLPNGDIEFMNVVERVHMVNQLPDRAPSEYDSERDTTPPPGFEDAARSIGVPLSTIRMTPRGKVISRNVQNRKAGAEEDGAIVIRLPEEPVAIGATWDEPLEVAVQLQDGGAKVIQARRHYKLLDVAHGMASIEVTYQVLSPINSQIESQLVQRLMKGKVRFDLAAGRIASQQFEIDKRILGFAGPTSSMQYVMRMEEKLINATPRLTRAPQPGRAAPSATQAASAPEKSPAAANSAGSRPTSNRPTRTANQRQAAPTGGRSLRR